MVGTEWRFQVQPAGEISRTLVPDIAFLSYDRMPVEELETTDIPRMAPDVVVEIRSPDDREEGYRGKSTSLSEGGHERRFPGGHGSEDHYCSRSPRISSCISRGETYSRGCAGIFDGG